MKERTNGLFKTKAAVAALLSIQIYATVILHYIGMFDRAFEMTFLSNVLTATLLAVAAVKSIATGRDIPPVLYLDVTVLLLVVLGICATFAPTATFVSTGVFLHLINPLAVAAFYLAFCAGRGISRAGVASTIVFPAMYYLFMIIYGRVTGGYVYVYFDPNGFDAAQLLGIGFAAAAIVLGVSYGILFLNGALRKKSDAAVHGKEVRYGRR